jgi:UPF0755 protein
VKKLVTLVFLVALLAVAAAAYVLLSPLAPPGETFVDIPTGTGTSGIAVRLEKAGVIRSRYAFELERLRHAGTLKAGEYRFADPATTSEVYARIARGDVYTRPLTIPEGFNLFDIAHAVEAAHLGSAADFLAAAHSQTSLIADLSPHATSLEGYLFPATYQFRRTTTIPQILQGMVTRFRDTAAKLGLTHSPNLVRTVILASLVEKEVGVDSERPLVAGVFENRLANGMRLQTDPTVIYAALVAGRWHGVIHQSDLAFDSPYNTYRVAGLPPGPIANPGVAALRAAMHPAATDALYFVADAQGHTRFSATLAEHQRKVADYRAAARARP